MHLRAANARGSCRGMGRNAAMRGEGECKPTLGRRHNAKVLLCCGLMNSGDNPEAVCFAKVYPGRLLAMRKSCA